MTPRTNDICRQWLNLIAAPAMWILPTLPQITQWGRTAKEFSDANNSLLVPHGIAFSIWLPIFVGCIGYAILQALKTNRSRDIFRQSGWWTGAGFIGVCIWALFSGWGSPMTARWGTALIFIPTVLCLVKAMLVLTHNRTSLDKTEHIWVWAPISLIAGWTSIAIFLNWTPIFTDNLAATLPEVTANLMILGLALMWAVFITRRSTANLAYAFPIMWGLGWLTFKAFGIGATPEAIGIGGIIGLIVLGATAVLSSKRTERSGSTIRT